MTGRSVCNDASADCRGVARAVVADQAALDARKQSKQAKTNAANATAEARSVDSRGVTDDAAIDARQQSKQAKSAAANATAGADANNKRSKKLFQEEARALGDTVGNLVGDVTGTVGDATGAVGDVADTVGLKTRDGNEVRAAVTDDAAIDARQQSKAAKSAAANGTAEARSVDGRGVTDDAAIDARQQSKAAKSAAANGTASAGGARKNRKNRKSRRSHQLW